MVSLSRHVSIQQEVKKNLKDRILKRQKEVTFLTVLTRKVRVEGEENSNIFSTVVNTQKGKPNELPLAL